MDGRYVNDIVNKVVKLIPQGYIFFYKNQQLQRKLFYMYLQIEEELVIEKKDTTSFIYFLYIQNIPLNMHG